MERHAIRAETWTMRKEDVKRIEAFEMWIWRRMERIIWTEHRTCEEVLKRWKKKDLNGYNLYKAEELDWTHSKRQLTLYKSSFVSYAPLCLILHLVHLVYYSSLLLGNNTYIFITKK